MGDDPAIFQLMIDILICCLVSVIFLDSSRHEPEKFWAIVLVVIKFCFFFALSGSQGFPSPRIHAILLTISACKISEVRSVAGSEFDFE